MKSSHCEQLFRIEVQKYRCMFAESIKSDKETCYCTRHEYVWSLYTCEENSTMKLVLSFDESVSLHSTFRLHHRVNLVKFVQFRHFSYQWSNWMWKAKNEKQTRSENSKWMLLKIYDYKSIRSSTHHVNFNFIHFCDNIL